MKKIIKAIMAAIVYSCYIAGYMANEELGYYDGLTDNYRQWSIEAAKKNI